MSFKVFFCENKVLAKIAEFTGLQNLIFLAFYRSYKTLVILTISRSMEFPMKVDTIKPGWSHCFYRWVKGFTFPSMYHLADRTVQILTNCRTMWHFISVSTVFCILSTSNSGPVFSAYWVYPIAALSFLFIGCIP